jgi:hypothetical protein
VANLDGGTLGYFLKDYCVYAMDVAPDGSAWLQAGEDRGDPGSSTSGVLTVPVHTFLITPEAVAATE